MTEESYGEFGYDGDGSAQDVLKWAIEKYHPHIAVACSFETPVVVHMAAQVRQDVRVFSIDTGRLPEETYHCAHDLQKQLGIKIEWYFPRHDAVERIEREKGVFSFRESLENRHECCYVRKIEPFNRALDGLQAWVSGLRRDETAMRRAAGKIERDEAHGGILKINPIVDWTSDQVREYIRRYRLPYNRLLEEGYTSIGCACCTRPVPPGEDPRSGRWWWEMPEHRECGMHVRTWNI